MSIPDRDPLADPSSDRHLHPLRDLPPAIVPTSSNVEPVGLDGFHLTDQGNADRFISAHGAGVRYVIEWRCWIYWDQTRWVPDPGAIRIRELVMEMNVGQWHLFGPADAAKAPHVTHARRSESATAIRATTELARSRPGVPLSVQDLDRDLMLLNTTNGTIDLCTGQIRDHDPEDLITKIATTHYDPNAEAPRFEQFLGSILPIPELRTFLQRLIGYTLTGSTEEQVLVLLIGDGANGKSTLIETLSDLMGDYATIAAKDLLLAQRHEAHPTSAADLHGARLAVAIETEIGDRLAEARVKRLTGGDTINARRMREDFWSFRPTHTLWLAANHRPGIDGTDHAIWRRIRLLPFDVTIASEDQDPKLPTKLAAEAPGILAWAVQGCMAWQSEGLNPPRAVTAATAAYRAEEDWFAAFVDDEGLGLNPSVVTASADLYSCYATWCTASGTTQLTKSAFGRELTHRGYEPTKHNGARVRRGIGRVGP